MRFKVRQTHWAILVWLVGALVMAAEEPAVREFACPYATGTITIDGRGDDAAWQSSPVIDEFVTGWAKGGPRPGKTATKARILWDEQNFYFIAEMEDHDLYADVTEHDGPTWLNDVFEVFLKPSDDRRSYYEFEINPRNAVFDLFLPSRGSGMVRRFVSDGDFHLQTAVTMRGTLNRWQDRDDGWTVEGAIPWSDLAHTGGKPSARDRWRFALCRYDYSVDFEDAELSSTATFTQPNFHRYEDYPYLRFLAPGQ